MNITGKQLRMARVSLKLRVDDLSKYTNVSWALIQRMERDDELIENQKIQEIINFFKKKNIEFYESEKNYEPFIKVKKK